MYQGQTVFSQVMGFLPQNKFRQCVNRYNGNYRVRSFTCYDQLLCMAFAQLTYRESLRDIQCCLRAMREKLYHMGIRGKISRSTLADANEARDWRIYSDFAQILIDEARRLYVDDSSAESWRSRRRSGVCTRTTGGSGRARAAKSSSTAASGPASTQRAISSGRAPNPARFTRCSTARASHSRAGATS